MVDPFALVDGDFCLLSTANSLGQLNRYTGHCRHPISVATHSYVLSYAVPEHLARAAIIHDMHESFCNDLSRPMKMQLPEYCRLEEVVQRQLTAMLGEPWENIEELAEYDSRICSDEMAQFMDYVRDEPPLGVTIPAWSHTEASLHFYDRAVELGVPLNA
jgi:hypothetical protein